MMGWCGPSATQGVDATMAKYKVGYLIGSLARESINR